MASASQAPELGVAHPGRSVFRYSQARDGFLAVGVRVEGLQRSVHRARLTRIVAERRRPLADKTFYQ